MGASLGHGPPAGRTPAGGPTSGFVVLVDFRLRSGTRSDFRALIDANARVSVAVEPGCTRFDVLEPEGEPDRILLFEIYRDRAAFETHLASPHFLAFDRASAALCVAKDVTICSLVCEGGAPTEGMPAHAG